MDHSVRNQRLGIIGFGFYYVDAFEVLKEPPVYQLEVPPMPIYRNSDGMEIHAHNLKAKNLSMHINFVSKH